MRRALGALAATAAALLVPAGVAQASAKPPTPSDGVFRCWTSTRTATINGKHVPSVTVDGTLAPFDPQWHTCTLTPALPTVANEWHLSWGKATDVIVITWISDAPNARQVPLGDGNGRMTCYTDPELHELNPYVSLDGAYPGRKATTCTLTPRPPLVYSRWTLTAPNGRSSVVTISEHPFI